jgi:type VI secretion system secreted protein Hcp
MPGNSFINFGGAVTTGESLQKNRAGTNGWIELNDWSWDIEAEHSNLKGSGAAVGKPNPGTLNFTHAFDLSSPVLLTKIVQGKSFPFVYIDMLKQTGGDETEQYFQIVMTDVFITKVSTKGGEDGAVTQDVDMVFKEVAVGYKAQTNQGKLENASIDLGWSITKMNTSPTDAKVAFDKKPT